MKHLRDEDTVRRAYIAAKEIGSVSHLLKDLPPLGQLQGNAVCSANLIMEKADGFLCQGLRLSQESWLTDGKKQSL
ncbi:MAG: hypothetical protein B6243_10010 [Anaerolineaceae bacterium 4572_5.2]|nr:MAG: hypothetical protein B6243_10010 [Anaerolineaceae bacterium 4572_5.2]